MTLYGRCEKSRHVTILTFRRPKHKSRFSLGTFGLRFGWPLKDCIIHYNTMNRLLIIRRSSGQHAHKTTRISCLSTLAVDAAESPIYVSATRQHVGKTSVSLALVSGLQKRFPQVGFIKPVGQTSLPVKEEDDDEEFHVDKDVVLVKEFFQLKSYRNMSPVLIPKGYTRQYLDGTIPETHQQDKIQNAFRQVSLDNDVVLCEGTGHCAVGSIVGASNAEVASWLGAHMVLVANGGLGSAFDELALNRNLCQHFGVPIAGVIINKVHPNKYEQTRQYLEKALQDRWDIPLLGCIPDKPYLGCPALADLEKLFGCQLITGSQHRLRHYEIKNLNLVTPSLCHFLENLRRDQKRTLYVCHSSRTDVVLAFLSEYTRQEDPEFALIICEGQYLDPKVQDMIDPHHAPPILTVSQTTHEVMEAIHQFTPKLNVADQNRVARTVNHYEQYIDFEQLLERTGNDSFPSIAAT